MPRPTLAVLDSYALLAFLFRETGHAQILDLLEWAVDNGRKHLMSSVNWAEVRYIVERKAGSHRWVETKEMLAGLPLEVTPVDQQLAELAAEFKIKGAMSLADCFAAALARQHGLPLYTGDPEFKRVEREVEIRWIGTDRR